MKTLIILLTFIFCFIIKAYPTDNITYDFENDRKVKRQKNVTYIQPESEYNKKKINEIEKKCIKIENDIEKINNEIDSLKNIIKNIEARMNQYVANSQNQMK